MPRRLPPSLVALIAAALVTAVAPALAAGLDTRITSGPKGLIASRTAAFRFRSSVPGATFQCKLDAKAWGGCSSPKRYTKLSQGKHTFRVRAIRAGSVDPTPAARTFTVDTVKPKTTIQTGPSGETNDPTPTFTFSSNEPGSFQCRVRASMSFSKCTSPFTPARALNDGPYDFQVRARDKAGNVDGTPASRTFTVERILTADLAGARTVAELYFPDELVMDVPPCVSSPVEAIVDCPGGVPLPPSDQLSITSDRMVVETSPNNYDVTIMSDVATLRAVAVGWPASTMSVECALAMTSAYGDSPVWTITMDLSFSTDPGTGQPQATYSDLDVSDVEPDDWGVNSWGEVAQVCGQGHFDSAFVAAIYASILDAHLGEIGNPLCAVTGPEHYGGCP